jgi:hypothetical protein
MPSEKSLIVNPPAHVLGPMILFFSRTKTFLLFEANSLAAARPPGPAPTIMTSYFLMIPPSFLIFQL